jgi:hypothetical protein
MCDIVVRMICRMSIVRDGLVRSGWLKVLVSDDEKVEPHLAKYVSLTLIKQHIAFVYLLCCVVFYI